MRQVSRSTLQQVEKFKYLGVVFTSNGRRSARRLIQAGFFKGVLGTRFGSLELTIGSLESAKIIIRPLGSEKSGPYRSTPGT